MLVKCGAAMNAKAADGCTALHLAARSGQPETAQRLMIRNATVDAVDNVRIVCGALSA